MKRMTCPYCHSKVKLFQFQNAFRLTSYKCSNCQKVSKVRRAWKSWLLLPIALFGGFVFGMIKAFGTKYLEVEPFIGELGLVAFAISLALA